MKKLGKLLPVILTVLLLAALAVIGWLLVERDGLLASEAALEKELLTAEQRLKDANGLLETSESTVAALQGDLSAARETLASTEAALAGMTAAREAADAQLATLSAELAVCTAQLQQATAEKEDADAALAALGYTRVQPAVVESMPQDEAAEDASAAEEAEAPAVDGDGEYFSEEPLEEVVPEAVPVTVYTADWLGVAFEAPVDWIIHADEEADCFFLRAEEPHHGVYASVMIRSAAEIPEAELLPERLAQLQPEGGNAMMDLLGETGLDAAHQALNEAGAPNGFRACAVVVDGQVFCVSVMACRVCFEDVMNDIFLPLCQSLRLIP